MSRKKQSRKQVAKTPLTGRAADVEKAVLAIERFFEIGAKSLEERPGRSGWRQAESEASRCGLNVDTLRKSREFASSYTRKRMEVLCDRCREVQSKQETGRPFFRRSHIVLLVGVANKKVRARLEREAIRGAWSVSRLRFAVRVESGKGMERGRKPFIPNEKSAILAQVRMLCMKWCRWHGKLEEQRGLAGAKVAEIPLRITKEIAAIAKSAHRLTALINAELKSPK